MSRGNTEAKVRSVIDLGDEEDIRRALLTATAQTPKPEGERGGGDDNTSLSSLTATITNYGAGSMGISRSSSLSSLNFGGSKEDGVRQTPPSVETLEWYIPCHDTSTSIVQTVDQEVKRLQCLRSYLPMEQSPAMHRLTSIAASTFGNCPISAITLIDLSHSALKGMHGLPLDTPATPRRLTFCSHTVISTLDCLVVLDTHKDARFKNHTFVTGTSFLASKECLLFMDFNSSLHFFCFLYQRTTLFAFLRRCTSDLARGVPTWHGLCHGYESTRERLPRAA